MRSCQILSFVLLDCYMANNSMALFLGDRRRDNVGWPVWFGCSFSTASITFDYRVTAELFFPFATTKISTKEFLACAARSLLKNHVVCDSIREPLVYTIHLFSPITNLARVIAVAGVGHLQCRLYGCILSINDVSQTLYCLHIYIFIYLLIYTGCPKKCIHALNNCKVGVY